MNGDGDVVGGDDDDDDDALERQYEAKRERAPVEVEMRPLLPIKTKQHGVVPQMVAREPGQCMFR